MTHSFLQEKRPMSDTQLVSKSDSVQQTVIHITPQIQVGGEELLIIGGPVPSKA
jgi:hypothetical protein